MIFIQSTIYFPVVISIVCSCWYHSQVTLLDLEGKQSPTLKAILNKETICFLQLITVIQLSSTTITLCHFAISDTRSDHGFNLNLGISNTYVGEGSSGNENSEQPHLNYVHHA
uniref:Uncharacterized protein n=1 Tax=Lactuca sativa TaxID=4236 RepID=A0A9R1WP05_LACSA|nr:hypothetical protein LSAT_V11C900490660 [Lactuca sativa]